MTELNGNILSLLLKVESIFGLYLVIKILSYQKYRTQMTYSKVKPELWLFQNISHVFDNLVRFLYYYFSYNFICNMCIGKGC